MRRSPLLPSLAFVALLAAAPIPAPVVVEGPLDLPDGVAVSPAVTTVEVPAGGALVTHHLALGSGARTVFALGAHDVAPGDDGAAVVGSATDALRLPADEVVLDAGERATITSVVDADPPTVLALTATPREAPDASAVTAYVVVAAPGSAAARPATLSATLGDEQLTVELTAPDRPRAVDVRVRLRALGGGTVVDETRTGVLVWPSTPRRLTWRLDLGPWPGPYRLEAVAGAGDAAPQRLERTVWPPWPVVAPVVAAALLLLTVATWLAVRRRARGAETTDAADA